MLPTNGRITQVFNTPVNYIAGRTKHEAIDIVTEGEKDYIAIACCKVHKTIKGHGETPVSGYGNEVYLDYGNGLIIRSCHHGEILVNEGDELVYGDVVAKIGRTGYRVPTSVYHTHIEAIQDGGRIDPLPIFKQLNERFMNELQQLNNNHESLSKLYVKDITEIKSTMEAMRTQIAGIQGQLDAQTKQLSEQVATLKKNKFGEKKLNKWYNKLLNK